MTTRDNPRGAADELGRGRRCPECLGPVNTQLDWRKMFCSEEHRLAFHNRQLKRGRSLVVPAMADRITRGGDRRYPRAAAGIVARQRSRRLIAQWIEEDRKAGRMMMDEYYELRERLGFHD